MASLLLALMFAACGGSAPGDSTGEQTSAEPAPLGEGNEELEAGVHSVELAERLPRIEITVPVGWFNFDGWSLTKGSDLPASMAVMFWDVDQVYPTPCRWKGEPMIDPGRDVEGLAAALADQPLRDATAPTEVTLAGTPGMYLELSVPTDIDLDDCDEGYFESWTGNDWASDRYQQKPGQVDRIWILDVDGQRLLIDAYYLPESTAEDRADLEGVVQSIQFRD